MSILTTRWWLDLLARCLCACLPRGLLFGTHSTHSPLLHQPLPPPRAPDSPILLHLGPLAGDVRSVLALTPAIPDAEGVAAALDSIRVHRVLAGSDPAKALVLECSLLGAGPDYRVTPACLKLRPADCPLMRRECATHLALGAEPAAARLFVRAWFSCRVCLPSGLWEGYCMPLADFTAHAVLFAQGPAARAWRARWPRLCARAGDSGAGVALPGRLLPEDDVLAAALELLCRLHDRGWAHGDSHAANFVCCAGRLLAIDCERAFPTRDPVQHFLDVQVRHTVLSL